MTNIKNQNNIINYSKMEYTRDLKVMRKSRYRLFFAFLIIVIAVGWIPIQLHEKDSISIFDWFYSIIMFSYGAYHVRGYLFGKAFVKINDQEIKFKLGIFDKEYKIDWSEINSIDYKTTKLVIIQKDTSTHDLKISEIEYLIVQELKDFIGKIARDKNVTINQN